MEWFTDFTDAFTADQWVVIGAVAATVTGIATALSAVLGVAWRFLDRKHAVWVTSEASSRWEFDQYADEVVGPQATFRLSNVGDATALEVRIVGVGCRVFATDRVRSPAQMRREPHMLIPAIESGDSAELMVAADPDEWERADVAVVFTVRPSLRRRRVALLSLRQIEERPSFSGNEATRHADENESHQAHEPEADSPPQPQQQAPSDRFAALPTRMRWAHKWWLRRRLRRR